MICIFTFTSCSHAELKKQEPNKELILPDTNVSLLNSWLDWIVSIEKDKHKTTSKTDNEKHFVYQVGDWECGIYETSLVPIDNSGQIVRPLICTNNKSKTAVSTWARCDLSFSICDANLFVEDKETAFKISIYGLRKK